MADSVKNISQVVKEEGGFQANSADSGNFYNGFNYGTKYGITPGAWVAYYGKDIKPDTIKTLTVEKAVPIYKKNYWDKIRGDEIENDSVAALMMFTVVNSGVGQTLAFRKIINALAGKKIVAENTGALTSNEVKLLNGLDQSEFFNLLKATREKFYRNLAAAKPANEKFLKGWLNRLNRHVFVGEKKSPGLNMLALAVLLLAVLLFLFLRK